MKFNNIKKFLVSITLGAMSFSIVGCSPVGAMIPALAACSGLLSGAAIGGGSYFLLNRTLNTTVTINWSYNELKNAILDYREWLTEQKLPCAYKNHTGPEMPDNMIDLYDSITRITTEDEESNRYNLIAKILDYCLCLTFLKEKINSPETTRYCITNYFSSVELKNEAYSCIFDCPASELVHCLLGQTDGDLEGMLKTLIVNFCKLSKNAGIR